MNAARVMVAEVLSGLEGVVPSFVRPIIDEALAGVVEILSSLAGEGSGDGSPSTGVPGLPGLPAGVPLPTEVIQPVLDAVAGFLPGACRASGTCRSAVCSAVSSQSERP